MGGETFIFRHYRPSVGRKVGLSHSHIHHGFDGEYHSDPEAKARVGLSVIGHLGLFMKLGTNAVSHIFSYDRITFRLNMAGDRGPDVIEPLVASHLLNARVQALLSYLQKLQCRVAYLSHRKAESRVSVITIPDSPAIDPDDVSLFQDAFRRGNPMNDFLVDRSAKGRLITQIPFEGRTAPFSHDPLLGQSIQIQ